MTAVAYRSGPAARTAPPRDARRRESLLLHHPELDALTTRWRLALNAADDAVAALAHGGGTVAVTPLEVRALRRELQQERSATARALAGVAGAEHVRLHTRVDAPRPTNRSLGLPDGVRLLVIELDGALTPSDELHAAAWAETFDELLTRRVERSGERFAPFRPFDSRVDYPWHIHGRPRLDGVRQFLASRGINLPEGTPQDAPGSETVYGLANRKNQVLQRRLRAGGVHAFAGSRRYLAAAREAGLRCAVVSASANTAAILDGARLSRLVDVRVDGITNEREHLRAKPAPDTILEACDEAGIVPWETAAFETSAVGVAAARAAHVAVVVGVDRRSDSASFPAGADRTIGDLAALLNHVPAA